MEGRFASYQLEEQNTSNHRGVVALVAKDVRIKAGGTHTIKRVITEYETREEFEKKLCAYTGYPILDYGFMTVEKGEPIRIRVKDAGMLKSIKLEYA